jgi:hypothetical protein
MNPAEVVAERAIPANRHPPTGSITITSRAPANQLGF